MLYVILVLFLVKKAYYKQSLKVHPDRVDDENKDVATEKFQTLGKVYTILSDTEKRKIYDETGNYLFSISLYLFTFTQCVPKVKQIFGCRICG